MIRIDRCVCMKRTFTELKELASARSLDFEALRTETGCGAGCGLCASYVKEMLRSGKTVFHELLVPDCKETLP